MLREYLMTAHFWSCLSDRAKEVVKRELEELDFDTIEKEHEELYEKIAHYKWEKYNLKKYKWKRENFVHIIKDDYLTTKCAEGELLWHLFEGEIQNQFRDDEDKKIPAVLAKRLIDKWVESRQKRNENKKIVWTETYN